MEQVTRVLVGTDLSAGSVGAMKVGAWIAEHAPAELHIACVIDAIPEEADETERSMHADLLLKAKAALDGFVAEQGFSDFAQTHIFENDADIGLAKAAHDLGAQVVVVGRAGRGQAVGLGAVVDRVVRRSPVSVLIVPEEPPASLTSIGVATSGRSRTAEHLARTARLAKRFKIDTVHVLHTCEVPRGYHMISSFEDAKERISKVRAEQVRVQVEASVAEMEDPPKFEYHVRLGSPKDVVDLAQELGLSLLVLGPHTRSSTADLMMDRVSEKIIQSATCPVWCEKTPGRSQGLIDALKRLFD